MDRLLAIQKDGTLYLNRRHPGSGEAEPRLARFAEVCGEAGPWLKYRIHRVSLWNAAISGMSGAEIASFLESACERPLPAALSARVARHMARVHALVLIREGETLVLRATEPGLLHHLASLRRLQDLLPPCGENDVCVEVDARHRGSLKRSLAAAGYPVQDQAGVLEGEHVPMALRPATRSAGAPFDLRDYQRDAIGAHLAGSWAGGSGVVVLPCGAGKTLVALGAMARLQTSTLILVTNVTAARQWIREIHERLDLDPSLVGEYSGARKDLRPITVATYQALTWRVPETERYPHMEVLGAARWGLVVYDEVHLLPAPVFRLTAGLQGLRRLGLTATLVREDGLETDVFSLIGPRQYDLPWRALENTHIAEAWCHEVRVRQEPRDRIAYLRLKGRARDRAAAENPAKMRVMRWLLKLHQGEGILIIGQYLDQLAEAARVTGAPLLTGETPQSERDALYAAFRAGALKTLVVSRVANFAVDLPDASVAIQLSGMFGSRQEEAQRLGRILRPKDRPAHFYSLVSAGTREEAWQEKRKRFLTEQGYTYRLLRAEDLLEPEREAAHV